MPPANAEKTLFGLIVTSILLALMAAVVDSTWHRREQPQSRAFQELVRGLNLGPALSFSANELPTDSLLNETCPWDCLRTPGGIDACPVPASSIPPQSPSAGQL